jgi:transglutaminase-like putative cysteine protease
MTRFSIMTEWGEMSSAEYHNTTLTTRPTVSTTLKPLSEGTTGTFEALAAMRQAVTLGLPPEYVSFRDGSIARAAAEICGQSADCVVAVYVFCRDDIAYVDHPWHMQVVQDARRTLMLGTGDCVSKSVLLSTLLASLGVTSRFVTQASTAVGGFDHVYVEALVSGSWLALDATADGRDGRPYGSPGWTQRLEDGGFEMSFEIFERNI